nr:unnamed protein product [Callosobruchus chinensis]
MIVQQHIAKIVEPYLIPYLRTLQNPIFQQYNARPHVASVTLDYLAHAEMNLMLWPPRSPDLSQLNLCG